MNTNYNSTGLTINNKTLSLLFSHCKSLFSTVHLPSHDHLHHMRVWNYATDLLTGLSGKGRTLNEQEISLLMLSVFFHDTGLTKTLSEEHGVESRRICEKFLEENPDIYPFDAGPALKAIELHDKKSSLLLYSDDPDMEILRILSVCDDLDAFGPAGILRYAEIYLLRDIPFKDLPAKILGNLARRFEFVSAQKWIPAEFLALHESRYRYITEFYSDMQYPQPPANKKIINTEIVESYMDNVYYGTTNILDFAGSIKNSDNRQKSLFGADLLKELIDGMKHLNM